MFHQLKNNVLIQKDFLDELAKAIAPEKKVIIITDAGFQANWFQHVKMLGWNFIGRVRGNVKFRLQTTGEI
ncbi:transposase (plasmid) [Serratia sp. AXJ-M]